MVTFNYLNKEKLPRVLVISASPFTKENSGGRTIGNLFLAYPSNKLACLYINDYPLDLIDCSYFLISDAMLVQHFVHFKKVGERKYFDGNSKMSNDRKTNAGVKSNPLTCLIREALWRTGAWSNKRLWTWIKAFNPEVIILSAGHFPYQYDMSVRIAKKMHAKLVLFNTEDYYFKKWNYLLDSSGHRRLYPFFHCIQRKSIRKAVNFSSLSIYHLDALQALYKNEFPNNHSFVIYTGSFWEPEPYVHTGKSLRLSYFGNMDGNRFLSLLDVATTLLKVDKNSVLDLYGPTPKDKAFNNLVILPNVVFHGMVPYDEIKKVAYKSDVLVHAVSFDAFNIKDRKNEFSTKIADCLSSGRCFLVYAPRELSFVQYIEKNNAAFVASTKDELFDILNDLFTNPAHMNAHIESAISLSQRNHSVDKNMEFFYDTLIQMVGERNDN
jgi:hypothetical protein